MPAVLRARACLTGKAQATVVLTVGLGGRFHGRLVVLCIESWRLRAADIAVDGAELWGRCCSLSRYYILLEYAGDDE